MAPLGARRLAEMVIAVYGDVPDPLASIPGVFLYLQVVALLDVGRVVRIGLLDELARRVPADALAGGIGERVGEGDHIALHVGESHRVPQSM